MKTFRTIIVRLLVPLFGLAFPAYADQTAPSREHLIGTWRWTATSMRGAQKLVYMRYYRDGRLAMWPQPKRWADARGVLWGRYSMKNAIMIWNTGRETNDNFKQTIEIEGNDLLLTEDHEGYGGHRSRYERILPTLEPGKLPDGSAAGFSSDEQ